MDAPAILINCVDRILDKSLDSSKVKQDYKGKKTPPITVPNGTKTYFSIGSYIYGKVLWARLNVETIVFNC